MRNLPKNPPVAGMDAIGNGAPPGDLGGSVNSRSVGITLRLGLMAVPSEMISPAEERCA